MQIGSLETCSIWTIAMIQSGSDDQSFWFSAQSQSGARVVTDRPQFCTHKTSHLTRILYPKGLASWIIMDVCAMYKGQHHFLHFRRGRCQKGTLTGHPVERLWTPLLKRHKGAIFTWESWDYCRGFDNNHVSFITSFFWTGGMGRNMEDVVRFKFKSIKETPRLYRRRRLVKHNGNSVAQGVLDLHPSCIWKCLPGDSWVTSLGV